MKTALITGAARGIGAATAKALAAKGTRVAVVGLEPERLAALTDELGPGHLWHPVDVTEPEALRTVVDATVAAFGRLDVVIANAGIVNYGTVRTTDPVDFARTIDVNVNGVFNTVRAALPSIIASRGHVLTIASLASFAPAPGMAAYAASKAGVDAMTCSLRNEVAHLGVTVGSAHFGWIDTDMVRDADAELPSFRRLRSRLPWPANSTTDVAECARAVVRGIERRSRRVYVPGSVAVAYWVRSLITSRFGDLATRRVMGGFIDAYEAESARLGRAIGNHADKAEHS
ncbi:SDR family oxidoreductase [Allokutzneria sp. A3M-2-11 16]|uniref:SDR family oxidoreductase n=1 Tax=Allokutzneria sp. A3M-2-11 16 TaxID=2962043 RepID=UPI0020B8A79E|nr:SDR family oxidoreductase [Allokutzneria sp. A3M-2-11 16]MCP3802486.1 SDR family oxidoreductase [Allokutzneria sp. A3M-2-11 16]